MSVQAIKLVGTSPSAAGTAAGTAVVGGLDKYNSLLLYCVLQGATGGTLDVYIQTLVHCTGESSSGVWIDYAHFPQLAAAAASTTRVWSVSRNVQLTTLTTVGSGTSPALAANTILGGEWGSQWRFVFEAGAGTSAGAVQTVWIFGSPSQIR